MKEIKLTKGKVAVVSDHRFEYLNQWKWYATQKEDGRWYAARTDGKFPFRKTVRMHRAIMGVTNPRVEVDHRDNDGLNNQDENIRVCTHTENGRNAKKRKDNSSGYIGVSRASKNRYKAVITVNQSAVYLGSFTTVEEAACAYDVAAQKYHGGFAKLNFPPDAKP